MARRGENIYKRGDGRWEGRYIRGRTPEGRAQYGYVYAATYSTCREKRRQCLRELPRVQARAEAPPLGRHPQNGSQQYANIPCTFGRQALLLEIT